MTFYLHLLVYQNIYKIKHVDNHLSANFYTELM